MDRLWFVPVCVTRTVVFGTAASVESTTEPTREPYNACAAAVAGFHTATAPRKTKCNFVIIASCGASVRIAHTGPNIWLGEESEQQRWFMTFLFFVPHRTYTPFQA